MAGEAGKRAEPDIALGSLLFVGATLAGLTPVADGDVYWHLAAAREMVRTGTFITHDAFSISAGGRPWSDVHWLFQLALYGVHCLGGLRGLVIGKCLVIGVGALFLLAAVEREARALFVPLLIAALFLARHLLLVRPVIASLLFLAYFLYALERYRLSGALRALVYLPFVQVAWSNCQGLFALGPALIAAYLVEAGAELFAASRARSAAVDESICLTAAKQRGMVLFVAFVSSGLGSLVTPYGAAMQALPGKLLARLVPRAGNPFDNVAENVPPFLLERFSPGQLWHFHWFLLLLALGIALSARRMLLSHLLLMLGFVGLALIANRNVLLLYWVATPLLARQLAPLALRAARAFAQRAGVLFARGLYYATVAALLLLAGTAAAREPTLSQPSPFRFPSESAQQLANLPDSGGIFCADQDGGYLIWKLYPRFKPYIDTRLVLRTPEQFREYLDLGEMPQRFEAFQARHHFAYVTLPVAYPDRYLHLIAQLYESATWKLIFTNGAEVLFARRDLATTAPELDLGDAATVDRVLARISRGFLHAPALRSAARIQLASLEIAVHEFRQAERVLARTESLAARSLQARARLAAGDVDGAQRLGEQLIAGDSQDIRNLNLMAMVYVRRGELEPAAKLLRKALAIDPFDSEATSLLATMEEHEHGR